MGTGPEISVILPTYRRHDYLPHSLRDLLQQELDEPFEIVVVRRVNDPRTEEIALASARAMPTSALRIATVHRPGIIRAMREGWRNTLGSLVAFCDDDARYPRDWLHRLRILLTDRSVGAAGGPAGRGTPVSRLTWFGRTTERPCRDRPCEAHFLTGYNMAFRRTALSLADFDPRLDGPGSSPGAELMLCLRARRRGFRVVYDPQLSIQHLAGPWVDAPRGPSPIRTEIYSRNVAYIMLSELPWISRAAFRPYFWLVGQWESPGLLVGLIGHLRRRVPHHRWIRISFRGKREGARLARSARREHRE